MTRAKGQVMTLTQGLTTTLMGFALLALAAGCGKGDAAGGGERNPFAERKAYIEDYMGVVEAAKGDKAKAVADGEAWIKANTAKIKDTCKLWEEYAQDLKKSSLNDGIVTSFDGYVARIHTFFGVDPKKPDMAKLRDAGAVTAQWMTIFRCHDAVKLP
ncbi:MAG: hypothetical protein ACI9MR_000362 [Myxococcota bacterium]|jgi:hypothetical protein